MKILIETYIDFINLKINNMEKISLIKYPDWSRDLLYWETKVINIDVQNWTIAKVEKLTMEKVNKILDIYYPEEWEWNCLILSPTYILEDE